MFFAELRCGAAEWNCGGGYCVPLDMHCDGVAQCPDMSDELGCAAPKRCAAGEFRCGDGACIPLPFKYDTFFLLTW